MSEGLTVREAKRLVGHFVYGLADTNGIFYVGQTRSPRRRFQQHAECRTKNLGLQRRVRAAGADLRIVLLRNNPPDLNEAERSEIRARGRQLVNLVGADDPSWEQNSCLPWGAGTGCQAPSTYLLMQVRPAVRAEIKAALKAMTDADRCIYELRLKAATAMHRPDGFGRWYQAARGRMLECIEAAYGAA